MHAYTRHIIAQLRPRSRVTLVCAFVVAALLTSPCWSKSPLGMFGKPEQKKAAANSLLPPKDAARACLATADELARNGHRREAIALYERARQLDPKQKQVSRVLAVLYDLEQMDKKAIAEYGLALEQSPDDADLLNDVGYFYYQRRDYVNAERWLKRAVAEAPQHELASINLALTLGAVGRFQESYEAFSQVLPAAAAHSNVGMMLAKRGHQVEAKRAFRTALELDPDLKAAQAGLTYLEQQELPAVSRRDSAPDATHEVAVKGTRKTQATAD